MGLIRQGCVRAQQDIAVVPFLVLLPLVENVDLVSQAGQDMSTVTLLTNLGPTLLQTLLGLGVLLVGGRVVLRRIFEMARADPLNPINPIALNTLEHPRPRGDCCCLTLQLCAAWSS